MKYHVERSITIDAKPEKVLPLIENFHNWNKWSPWTIVDPDHKSSVDGTAGQVGHKMSWDGEIVGSGAMDIEKIEGDTIYHNLEFFKPFKSKAKSSFIVEEDGDKTKITWTMDSSLPWFMFFMLGMMKAWIGMDYDRGLTMIKALVEKGTVNATTTNEGMVDFKGFSYVGLKGSATKDNMPKEMSAQFEKLMNDLEKVGAKAEKWIAIYTKVDMKTQTFTWIAAASDEDLKGKNMPQEYTTGEIPSQKMLKIQHKGSYNFLGNAWSMGMMYLQAKKIKQNGKPFELYVNNPQTTKEDDLMTEIYFPVKK